MVLESMLTVVIALAVSVARSVAGWLENALKDGQIDRFEWGLLGATIVRVTIIGVGVFLSTDLSIIASTVAAATTDYIIGLFNK